MAEALTAPDVERREAPRPAAPTGRDYSGRFRVAFALLGLIGVAGAVTAITLISIGKPPPGPRWSAWHPTRDGDAGVQQIADHVAPAYHLPGGAQLVAVRGGPLQIAGLPVTVVLQNNGSTRFVEGKGALYTLCGLGPRCSIKNGKPSVERHLLLRREALELALYTFRYVKDVDQVVVLLPPPPGQPPSQAMFFRPHDVKGWLDRPLRLTLPSPPPSIKALRAGRGTDYLNRVTARDLFSFDVQQGQDASVFLVLNPLDLSGGSSGGSGSSKP
jgi:hypothetical protein